MDLADVLIKALPLLFAGGALYLQFRKAPVDTKKTSLEAEGQLLENYDKLTDAFSRKEDTLYRMRVLKNKDRAEVRVLRQILRDHNLLTPDVEQLIKDYREQVDIDEGITDAK